MDNPITREEMYLAAAAGERLNLPEPITRVEYYLKRIAERYGGGTGTGGNAEDGFSPIATVTQTDSGAVISITDKNGTTTATINDGADGSNGKDGTSVTVKSVSESTADGGSNVVTFSDGKTLTIKNGSKGSKGDKGDAYTLTSADKTSIVNAVISAVPTILAASTSEVTPTQVLQAITEGSDVVIGHADATFGNVHFTYFIYAANLGMIISSAVIMYSGNVMTCQLVGRLTSNTWESLIVPLPQKSDIPTMNEIVDAVIAALPVYNGEVG